MRAILAGLLACSLCLWAQESDAPASAQPSGTAPAPSAQPPDPPLDPPIAAPPAPVVLRPLPPVDREVTWLGLAGNIEQDQRAIWLAPLKLRQRKYWIPTAVILATTVGLVALDAKEGQYFRNSQSYNAFNNVLKGSYTQNGLIVAPFALYGAGLLVKDSKMKSTALLAGEAVIDSEILTTIFKDIDRRQRPADLAVNANFSDSWFDGKPGIQGRGSFPSGHTIAAFSIATVIARRYGNHKWVPFLAYGTAAAIGFSRMTLSSHWGSDVFVGGVLGYSIARFDVLRQ